MIKFKVLKYKHYKRANQLNAEIESGRATEDEILSFVVSLVDGWDFTDAETGSPLETDETGMVELSLEQYKELMAEFNRRMSGEQTVPKTSGEQSPSGSTRSKAARKPRRKSPPGSATS